MGRKTGGIKKNTKKTTDFLSSAALSLDDSQTNPIARHSSYTRVDMF